VPVNTVDEADLARRLAAYLVSRDGDSLERTVVTRLAERGDTLAVAESCTGGMLGARISRVPGASEVWLGGVQSYADDVKRRLLAVPADLIESEGAVSEAVARAMAAGVRRSLGSDWALSVTGIAGPGGERPGKPVGTIHLGLAGPTPAAARHLALTAGWDRENNRRFAVQQALTLLWRAIRDGDGSAAP
jgi:nicotinamide-nucleotide amidase